MKKRKMRRLLKALETIAIICAILSAFLAGHLTGVLHALSDSEYVVAELGDPDIPQPFDFRLWIELDGHLFEHFGFFA